MDAAEEPAVVVDVRAPSAGLLALVPELAPSDRCVPPEESPPDRPPPDFSPFDVPLPDFSLPDFWLPDLSPPDLSPPDLSPPDLSPLDFSPAEEDSGPDAPLRAFSRLSVR